MSNFSKILREGEEVLRVCYRHGASFAHWWLAGGILVAAGCFLLPWLASHGAIGAAAVTLLLSTGTAILLRTALIWRGNMLILTKDRVVDVSRPSLLHKTVSYVFYADIQDLSWERNGIWALLWRYGDVRVVASAGSVHLMLKSLPEPKAIHEVLVQHCRKQ